MKFEELVNEIDVERLNKLSVEVMSEKEEIPPSFCDEYRKVRRLICACLKWIEMIPIFGKQLAAAIRVLISIADRMCGISEECG